MSSVIISTCLAAFALLWAFTGRLSDQSTLRRMIERIVSLPVWLWLVIGVAIFVLPVLEYWITAKSHPNALAGFLPWADATEYYQCSQAFLLGFEAPAHCGKRSFYVAFMADLLWLTGNRLQLALLLQAFLVGSSAVIFAREVGRSLNGAAALAAYAVLYQFAAVLCASLVMTENIGLVLGTLGLALLWRCADNMNLPLFLAGIAVLAAGLAARPGPMFVLPALVVWYFLYAKGTIRLRLTNAGLAVPMAALAIALTVSPILVAGGTLGNTHSNFSYSLYGLAAGGENWLYVTIERPDLFTQHDEGLSVTDRVYRAAFESIINRPHLFLLGYVKGIGGYFDDLFRYAAEFKTLRLAVFLPLWIIGVWQTLRRWREPRPAMFLWLQAGILISSPFIIVDETNRIFAATAAVDGTFVAYGVFWVWEKCAGETDSAAPGLSANQKWRPLAAMGVTALVLPIALVAAIRPGAFASSHQVASCQEDQETVLVEPGRSTLLLPLVRAGEETLVPLRVRADQFGSRLHRAVARKQELRLPAGITLFWGIGLGTEGAGEQAYFFWSGEIPPEARRVTFCLEPPETGRRIRAAARVLRE